MRCFLYHRYDDILEIPLQPLYDNLTSYTYEVFEKDPIKYMYYQRAIEGALSDQISDADAETKTVTIFWPENTHNHETRMSINRDSMYLYDDH